LSLKEVVCSSSSVVVVVECGAMVVDDLLGIRDRVVSVWTGSHCTCWWNIWRYEVVMWWVWLVGGKEYIKM